MTIYNPSPEEVARAEKRWGTMRIIGINREPNQPAGQYMMKFGCDVCSIETTWWAVQMLETDAPMPECMNCGGKL